VVREISIHDDYKVTRAELQSMDVGRSVPPPLHVNISSRVPPPFLLTRDRACLRVA
jgi:hypothetical protein